MGSAEREFDAFMRSSYPALVRAARLLADDAGVAEDLAQEALRRTYTHWASLRDTSAAWAYTHTTMVRLARRGRLRRWRREIPTERVPDRPADDGLEGVDRAHSIRQALMTLPPRDREVIVLRYLADLTEEQTARCLKCPVGTVKSRANRALRALRGSGWLNDDVVEVTHD